MLSIDEKLYNKMPPELRAMFKELPNPERDEVVGEFPDTKGSYAVRKNGNNAKGIFPVKIAVGSENVDYGDSGSASRFFYCAKASKSERNMGCEGLEEKHASHDGRNKHIENQYQRHDNIQQNYHPTVKPISLMKYLCRLITPPDGIVLDPFAGSGSTCIACKMEGFNYIGIEKEADYVEIAKHRLESINFKQETLI